MIEIQVFKGERLRQVVRIERGQYIIGRSMQSDIIVPDHRVSRRHCSLYFDPDQQSFCLVDLSSKIGTFINGAKVTKATRLSIGDSISFGTLSEFVLKFAHPQSSPLIAPNTPKESKEDLPQVEEAAKRITSSINLGRVVAQSESHLVQLRAFDPAVEAPKKGDQTGSSVAGQFYELVYKLSLAPPQTHLHEVIAEHVFRTTPADRLLVIRLQPPPDSMPVGAPYSDGGDSGRDLGGEPKPTLPPSMPTAVSQEAVADLPPGTLTTNPSTPPRGSAPFMNIGGHTMYLEFCEYAPASGAIAKTVGSRYSQSLVRKAISEHKGLLLATEGDPSQSQSFINATSTLCVPIIGRAETLGCMYIDVIGGMRGSFTPAHLELVGMYAYLFGLHLERQKAIEDRRESERLASAGLAVFGAAHYLKNVLTALQGSRQIIDTLLRKKQFEQIDSTWAVMGRSLEAIGSTVKKMLDFARNASIEPEETDAIEWAGAAIEPFEALCDERKIALKFNVVGEPFIVSIDRRTIADVVQNLVSNSIDAIRDDHRVVKPAPSLEVTLRFHTYPRQFVVEVTDNGPGIAPNAQPRVFDLFFSTKGAGGSGLGLALCRKYVVAHGGSMTFQTSHEGTTFRVALPQRPSSPIDSPHLEL